MNTDSRATRRFNAIKQTLTPYSGKTLTLCMALILGACASTGEKIDEAQTAESKPVVKTAEPASSEPAPTAAELMKTLQAPLKEPEPAQPSKTAATESPAKVEMKKTQAKESEKLAEKTAVVAEPLQAATPEKTPQKVVSMTPSSVKTPASESTPVVKKAEGSVEQKASMAVTEPVASLDAKPFSVTAKQLPFSYDIWTIRKGNTPLTNQGLVIATPTWEMGKEGYMSQIWLTLMEDKIHVNSSSDIETASKGLGIRIDGGDLIPFSSIAETNIGVIEGRWLDRLAKAGKIDIYLGFFPGKKPTSETFKSDLSLSNLDRIVATYRVLNR